MVFILHDGQFARGSQKQPHQVDKQYLELNFKHDRTDGLRMGEEFSNFQIEAKKAWE